MYDRDLDRPPARSIRLASTSNRRDPRRDGGESMGRYAQTPPLGRSRQRNTYGYVRPNRIFTRNRLSYRLRSPHAVLAAVIIAIVCIGAFGAVTSMQRHAAEVAAQEQAAAEKKRLAKQVVRPDKLGKTLLPASTPRRDWRQGSMPRLYQTDPAWADEPFAGGTIRSSACGPTCLNMVYVYLTGRTDMDPADMSAFAEQNNFAPTGATEWSFMTRGASILGINSTQIHPTRSDIENSLANGRPVICSVTEGDFTDVGHYIVLRGIDERGMVEVFDPNSPYNSARRWDVQRILTQTKACWSFWM